MPKILIVCTGNQCRSPMAEGLMRAALNAAGLQGWEVGSAGTWTDDGHPATPDAVRAASALGVDIARHRSRRITGTLLAQADLILALTRAHAESMRAEFPGLRAPIWLMSELGGAKYDIPDPIGQPYDEYYATARELQRLIQQGLGKVQETLTQAS